MSEQLPQQCELVLPQNIEELLKTSLIGSGLPGSDTRKYFVAGYPGLLVRHNPGYPLGQVSEAISACKKVLTFGVDMLPAQVLPGPGEDAYVVTRYIDGGGFRKRATR